MKAQGTGSRRWLAFKASPSDQSEIPSQRATDLLHPGTYRPRLAPRILDDGRHCLLLSRLESQPWDCNSFPMARPMPPLALVTMMIGAAIPESS
jgi:hypothetical protein